jgi:membrane protease YdiL (CAAX protease family)
VLNELQPITGPEQPERVLTYCVNCNNVLNKEVRFCSHCGSSQINGTVEAANQKWDAIKQIVIFFIIEAILCAVASFIPFFNSFVWSVVFDVMLATSAIVFFFHSWSLNKSLLTWNNFSLPKLLALIVIAAVGSLIIGFIVRWLNHVIFSKQFSYYAFYANHTYGKLLTVFFVAVMPALFEELGFRGFLLQKLLLVVEKKQAIIISAFLFAIMHLSFISFFWIFPFGLLVAYVRVKENTLWYGVFIHFTFNLTVCLAEFYKMNHI